MDNFEEALKHITSFVKEDDNEVNTSILTFKIYSFEDLPLNTAFINRGGTYFIKFGKHIIAMISKDKPVEFRHSFDFPVYLASTDILCLYSELKESSKFSLGFAAQERIQAVIKYIDNIIQNSQL